jgi:retinoid hydroxylase
MSQPPPGSLGLPFVGEMSQFLKDPFQFTLSRTKEHGPLWKTRILGDTVVFFAGPKQFELFMDPENFTRQAASPKFVQQLLHPDAVPFLDGDRHKTRKRLLLAAFTDDAIESYLPNITRIMQRFVTRWVTVGEVAAATDLAQAGFDIADMLFAGADPDVSNTDGNRDFQAMNRGLLAPPVNLPFTLYGKAIKARDRLRAYIKRAVAANDGGALGVLKRARGPAGEQLTAEELEIELLHFYFAAHGGLTAALAWSLVILGEHPELAARLRAEADAVLGDGAPTFAEIRRLSLARSTMRELLRYYPLAPFTFMGIAKRDVEIDGFSIRAGWKGAGAIWAVHADASTFAEPRRFDPERLADSAVAKLPDGSFVPQGGGPALGHRCPGEALIQTVVPGFLGWFTKHYDLAWQAQDTTPAGAGLGPLPKDGVRVKITNRK